MVESGELSIKNFAVDNANYCQSPGF